MKRIAILTSGGDAPGMNAAIRAAVRLAAARGVEILGVRRGYLGLMQGEFLPLDSTAVGGIIEAGGTILRTARCEPFKTAEGQGQALAALERAGVDGLLVVGGNGSQAGAFRLSQLGVPVVGIPSTIDNDVPGTDQTIGADSALNTIVQAIDRIRDTASAHERTFVVETMGRDCGWLALNAALATGADIVLIPEAPIPLSDVAGRVRERRRLRKAHTIIVVAEGAGRGVDVAAYLADLTGLEVRATVLGYIQRGGAPTAFDRILASRLAAAAAEALLGGQTGVLIGLQGRDLVPIPLDRTVAERRALNLDLFRLEGIFSV
ncbi:MAG: 6-phosphofructokinase [Armatimonadota bacterium]|nr:6-phosphofructokinase [Armatimonadota bacterium]MDR7449690.1 6-phosphofructokinase [Armatimonadota bacterium]MDR7458394.1 6-phosphofructokinase [Armatimonadota bacterium]MDR7478803.1 6-phosphofructokinase [Armatimonadota bacterium]MDR7488826.1 6-phosphofructokinase [Armatimonadota bacterium]